MFRIEPLSRKPVYEQLVEQTETLVLNGGLHAGDQMPSVRTLAVTLSINPNTIQKAYLELDRRGILQAAPGKGNFIAPEARERLCRQKRTELGAFDALARELMLAGVKPDDLRARIQTLAETTLKGEATDD